MRIEDVISAASEELNASYENNALWFEVLIHQAIRSHKTPKKFKEVHVRLEAQDNKIQLPDGWMRILGLYDCNTSLKYCYNSNETLTARDLGGASTTFLAVTLAPTIPVFQKDGKTYAGPLGAGYSDRNNPLHMQDLAKWNNANRLNAFGNIYLEIQPVKNLFLKSTIGADNSFFSNKVITPTFSEGALNRTTNSLSFDKNQYLSTTFSNTLRYNFNLKSDHSFKILLGTELIKTNLDSSFGKKEGYALQNKDDSR